MEGLAFLNKSELLTIIELFYFLQKHLLIHVSNYMIENYILVMYLCLLWNT